MSGLLSKRPGGGAGLSEAAKEEHDSLGQAHGGDTLTRYFSTPHPSKDVRAAGVGVAGCRVHSGGDAPAPCARAAAAQHVQCGSPG
jgi:hypothetical protein